MHPSNCGPQAPSTLIILTQDVYLAYAYVNVDLDDIGDDPSSSIVLGTHYTGLGWFGRDRFQVTGHSQFGRPRNMVQKSGQKRTPYGKKKSLLQQTRQALISTLEFHVVVTV